MNFSNQCEVKVFQRNVIKNRRQLSACHVSIASQKQRKELTEPGEGGSILKGFQKGVQKPFWLLLGPFNL